MLALSVGCLIILRVNLSTFSYHKKHNKEIYFHVEDNVHIFVWLQLLK